MQTAVVSTPSSITQPVLSREAGWLLAELIAKWACLVFDGQEWKMYQCGHESDAKFQWPSRYLGTVPELIRVGAILEVNTCVFVVSQVGYGLFGQGTRES